MLALPLAIYLALQHFQPRTVTLMLLALLVLRSPARTWHWLRRLGWAAWLLAAGIAALTSFLWQANDPIWVLLYPVLMSGAMLAAFAYSLWRPPSMVERFARLREPDLPPEGVAYTRRVTQVWCGFFVLNGGIAAWTAFAAAREVWVLYNGLISYLLMGLLLAGEWLYRQRRLGHAAQRTEP